MSAMSKIFAELVNGISCKEAVHPWTNSCWKFRKYYLWRIIQGNLKFFAPIAMIPAMLKVKHFGSVWLKDVSIHYLIVVLHGIFVASSCLWGLCFFRNLFGQFKYMYILTVPSFLAGFSAILLPKKIAIGHATHMTGMAIESAIRKSNSSIISWLRKSKATGTISFMIMSAIILRLLRKLKQAPAIFWFIRPNKSNNSDNQKCEHDNKCTEHFLRGVTSYAAIGIGLEFAKYIFFNISNVTENPMKFMIGLMKKINAPLVQFLTLYIGIYRALQCYLLQQNIFKLNEANTIAAGISGISYYFVSSYNLFTMGLISMMQLLLLDFQCRNLPRGMVYLQELSKKIPFRVIMFAFGLAYVIHSRVFYPYSLPKYGLKCIDYEAGNIAYIAGERFVKMWLSSDK